MSSLNTQLRLSQHAIKDLHLMSLRSDKLNAILDVADEIGPYPGITQFARKVSESVQVDHGEVMQIVRALVNLQNTKEKLDCDTNAILGMIQPHILKPPPEPGSEQGTTVADNIAAALNRLNPKHPLISTEKATRIAFQHQNILQEAKIITDLRPVFTENGSDITQMIVTHMLVINYSDGEGKSIHFALDASDVSNLKKICERAEKKANAVLESLKGLEWPTNIYGLDVG